MKSKTGFWTLFCGVFIASCSSASGTIPTVSPSDVHATIPANLEATSSPTQGATMVVPLVTSIPPALPGIPSPDPTITINPLQLFFPTIIPAEGAEYRPPLYSVPWALTPYDHFYFAAPIAATFPGDPVWDYRYGGTYFGPDIIHTGIDLPAPRGAEVMAAGPGIIVWAGIGLFSGSRYNLKDPYGLAVAIRHDFGYKGLPLYSIYAHMEEVDVVVGQWLNTGNVVGHVGTTGMTTGPHLHFEIRIGENDFWQTRNPELWIAPPQGYGVLVGRVMSTANNLLDSYKVLLKSYTTKKQYEVKTYAELTIHSDQYYSENMVLGNLPAGLYEINIPYGALNRKTDIQIYPGEVSYFSFSGFNGYNFSPPSPPATIIP